jgi:hypothetical protein
VKGKETLLGDLRIRKDDDELPREGFSRKIVILKNNEIKLSVRKSYKEKINTRKKKEEHMTMKDEKKPKRTKHTYDKEEEEISRIPVEREPSAIEIVQKDKDRGFRIGNKPKGI